MKWIYMFLGLPAWNVVFDLCFKKDGLSLRTLAWEGGIVITLCCAYLFRNA